MAVWTVFPLQVVLPAHRVGGEVSLKSLSLWWNLSFSSRSSKPLLAYKATKPQTDIRHSGIYLCQRLWQGHLFTFYHWLVHSGQFHSVNGLFLLIYWKYTCSQWDMSFNRPLLTQWITIMGTSKHEMHILSSGWIMPEYPTPPHCVFSASVHLALWWVLHPGFLWAVQFFFSLLLSL